MKYNSILGYTLSTVVAISLTWFGVSYATNQSEAPTTASNPVIMQELAAKKYLFKHAPSNGGGMPTVAPRMSKRQKRAHEHAVVSDAVKQTPEIADYFLGRAYRGTAAEDAKLYSIVEKLSRIQLTHTATGFEYTFKSGAVCHEERYKGSLEMKEKTVTKDNLEMEVVTVPC